MRVHPTAYIPTPCCHAPAVPTHSPRTPTHPHAAVVHGAWVHDVTMCPNETRGDAWNDSWGGARLSISVVIHETVSGIFVPYRNNPTHA